MQTYYKLSNYYSFYLQDIKIITSVLNLFKFKIKVLTHNVLV